MRSICRKAQIANGQVIVAEFGGELAGFAAVVGGELDGLFVEPDLWGHGIGRALVDAATHEARRKGLALTVIADSACPALLRELRVHRSKARSRRGSGWRSG